MKSRLLHVATWKRTSVTRALTPLLQVAVVRESVYRGVQDELHRPFFHVENVRFPGEVSILAFSQFKKISLLNKILDVVDQF